MKSLASIGSRYDDITSMRQIRHWVEQGHVASSGTPLHMLDDIEAAVLECMIKLVAWGLKPSNAAPIARDFVTSGLPRKDYPIEGVGYLTLMR